MSEKKAPMEFWIIDKPYHRYSDISCYEAWDEKPVLDESEESIHCREVIPEPLISEEEIQEAALLWCKNHQFSNKDRGQAFVDAVKWALQKIKGGEV